MDTNTMRHLSGSKVGVETLVQALSDVVSKNGNQLPIEFVNYAANSVVSNIETQLKSIERGDELVDMLNGKLQKEEG